MFLSLFSSFPNQSPFPTLSIPNSILILSYSFSLSHPFIFCLFFSYFPIPSPFPTLSFFISFSHTFLFFLTFPSFHISSLFLILSYSKSPFSTLSRYNSSYNVQRNISRYVQVYKYRINYDICYIFSLSELVLETIHNIFFFLFKTKEIFSLFCSTNRHVASLDEMFMISLMKNLIFIFLIFINININFPD